MVNKDEYIMLRYVITIEQSISRFAVKKLRQFFFKFMRSCIKSLVLFFTALIQY